MPKDLRARQIEREAQARQIALGRRAKVIQAGFLGPVLKRWINADVVPIAALLRSVAGAYVEGRMGDVAQLLDMPASELTERERPLMPLMEWCLVGKSPGRATLKETTYADDLALTFMATVVTRVAQGSCTLSAALAVAADNLRDTVQGQFLSSIQGADSMQAVREKHPKLWQQRKSLRRICARLHSQVRPQLAAEGTGRPLQTVGHKKVLFVLEGDRERMLTLRPPTPLDWEVMSLCWRDERDGGTHPHRSLWLGLAGLLLACAQRCGGWFEVAETKVARRKHVRTTKHLVLSERASEAIEKDIERWTSLGFSPQPMIVPPEGNDYLTVKHKPVTGQRPPKGLITKAAGSSAWNDGAGALSSTPWQVNTFTLSLMEPAHTSTPGGSLSLSDTFRIAEHKRLASEEAFYLPTCMDFRGRIYYRTPWVNPQSGDLGKALLRFPSNRPAEGGDKMLDMDSYHDQQVSLVMHLASLYGHGLDKAPFHERWAWFQKTDPQVCPEGAEKPLTLAAAWELMKDEETDSIPVQLDGTCNGLQHLSALLRDEVAAPRVNLGVSTLTNPPQDIYALGAERVWGFIQHSHQETDWWLRLAAAGLTISRTILKRALMVLPFGGTRDAVRQVVRDEVLKQLHASSEVRDASKGEKTLVDFDSPWHRHLADGYEAFKLRPLGEHPLFVSDCNKLAGLIWDCIQPAVPRAMAFMKALQEIGSWVGERGLSWRVGGGSPGKSGSPLWIVQAKSKAQRKQVTMRGFHLPNMVRRLTLMSNSNEVDGRAHRTGIVANFIHSLDAAHLAASISRFRARGGGCVGSVHDCLLVRPSEAALMGRCLRDCFVEMYEEDPLSWPVRVTARERVFEGTIEVDGTLWTEYPSWYALAEAAGVSFPERGTFDITEVRDSAWFFS